MKSHSVIYCTLIIRSQIEYSTTAQAMIVRCVLEKPATGQRHGFTDVDALLTALRAELVEMQYRLIALEGGKKNNGSTGSQGFPMSQNNLQIGS